MNEAGSRLKKVAHLPEEGSFGNKDRNKITDTLDSFSSFLARCKQRIVDVRPVVQAALDSRIYIDQVFKFFSVISTIILEMLLVFYWGKSFNWISGTVLLILVQFIVVTFEIKRNCYL